MTLAIDRFDEFFHACNGRSPFPWQTRLANLVFTSGWPDCIDLPTASGKTACIDAAVFVAACQACLPSELRTVGRRIFFTVNRRVIVDEAFIRSKSLAEKLLKAEAENRGIIHEVACALRMLNEESNPAFAPPLAIAQLRGGVYRDAAWARSLTQPIVVCTTVDQLGSRMLFRGYGTSDGALPMHAALCTHDATILLDEAHVTKAFCETLDLLDRYQSVRSETSAVGVPFRYVQMTATPHRQVEKPFQLDEADYQNSVLKSRQEASKPATLHAIEKKKSLVDSISTDAVRIGSEAPRALGIIVNRVQTARDIAKQIETKLNHLKLECDVHLVIGRMRPIDRDVLQNDLREIVGPDRPTVLDKSVFIVATQCLEVGADYDFDALLTECASIDALRQRFGRLNRAGRPIEAITSIYFQEPAEKGEDPIYGTAITTTWNWLHAARAEDEKVDFGIRKFTELWDKVAADDRAAMASPSPHAAVLLPAHLDLLCQTSPRPTPEPEISYFIHGPQRSNADVNVCWRADLGDSPSLWADIVRLLPPTSMECMAVPIWTIRRWLLGQPIDNYRDADVTVTESVEDPRKATEKNLNAKTVLRWRGSGDQTITTTDATNIRPGDTIVISVRDGGWDFFGHIPNAPTQDELTRLKSGTDPQHQAILAECNKIDVAEACCRFKNLRHVIRLHSAFPHRAALRSLPISELRIGLEGVTDAEFGTSAPIKQLKSIKESIRKNLERHQYPSATSDSSSDESVSDEIVYCRWLLPNQTQLELPSPDNDDEEDDRSQSSLAVSLLDHTKHVVERISRVTEKLSTQYDSQCALAAKWHDLGKADLRFQAMLCGLTPSETMERQMELAKSDGRRLTNTEREAIRKRAQLPTGFRHEFLSSQLVENIILVQESNIDTDVVLRLIESHHGFARPFAGVVCDRPTSQNTDTTNVAFSELRSVYLRKSDHWPEIEMDGDKRDGFAPLHRLDSGVSQRFWKLTRRFGWWGLTYMEAILRLADQRASAAEELAQK